MLPVIATSLPDSVVNAVDEVTPPTALSADKARATYRLATSVVLCTLNGAVPVAIVLTICPELVTPSNVPSPVT